MMRQRVESKGVYDFRSLFLMLVERKLHRGSVHLPTTKIIIATVELVSFGLKSLGLLTRPKMIDKRKLVESKRKKIDDVRPFQLHGLHRLEAILCS